MLSTVHMWEENAKRHNTTDSTVQLVHLYIFTLCICEMKMLFTAKTQYRTFETNIPRKGIGRGQSSPNFHIHVPVSNLYIPGLPFLLQENTVCGPILGIYKSLTDT
jgi:hypothetical protein